MASAYRDSKGVVLQYTGYAGTRRRQRVRMDMDAARLRSVECEQLCRSLRQDPSIAALHRAIELGAITPEEAASIDGVAQPAPSNRVTIREAALMHPTSSREQERDSQELIRHLRELDEFVEFSGVALLADLQISHVQRYLRHLQRAGYSWDGRRHRIIMLRRACRMAPSYRLPDVLAGIQLDRREQPPRVTVWTPEQARSVLKAFKSPALGICALGLAGLRPSEIIRATAADLQGDLLTVGGRESKTEASRRTLPLPPVILATLPESGPLAGRRHDKWSLPKFWQQALDAAGIEHIQLKSLRKSCATMLIEAAVDPGLVESWLGHTYSGVLQVTNRHYLAPRRVESLRPIAAMLEALYAG